MIWKAVWAYVVLTAVLGKRHPNLKHEPVHRMSALRAYWFMRDVRLAKRLP